MLKPCGVSEHFCKLSRSPLRKNVILYSFDVTKSFKLYCDSSDCAVGAVLIQQDNCGFEGPISFIGKKLIDTQQRWATIEREAYAIALALTKLKEIIIGLNIHIFTDRNPLTYLLIWTCEISKVDTSLANFLM